MPKLNRIAVSPSAPFPWLAAPAPFRRRRSNRRRSSPFSASMTVTAEGMYRLGRYYEGQARFEQAINAYREAIRRDPLMVEAYTALGTSLAAQQRYDEAIRQFQAAIVLAPNAAHLHNNLGYAYLLSGQTEQAVKALEEAQRLDPCTCEVRREPANCSAKLGNSVPQTVSSPSTTPAVQSVTMPAPGTSLVEVAPQVFELRTSPKPRHFEKIEAVPLPPLPEPQPRATSAPSQAGNRQRQWRPGTREARGRAAGGCGRAHSAPDEPAPFNHPTTEVQYREGYAAAAAALASSCSTCRSSLSTTLRATSTCASSWARMR